jgi:hypothetical protein
MPKSGLALYHVLRETRKRETGFKIIYTMSSRQEVGKANAQGNHAMSLKKERKKE